MRRIVPGTFHGSVGSGGVRGIPGCTTPPTVKDNREPGVARSNAGTDACAEAASTAAIARGATGPGIAERAGCRMPGKRPAGSYLRARRRVMNARNATATINAAHSSTR